MSGKDHYAASFEADSLRLLKAARAVIRIWEGEWDSSKHMFAAMDELIEAADQLDPYFDTEDGR